MCLAQSCARQPLQGLLIADKGVATKVHALERKVSAHERNIADLADPMSRLLATPAAAPKRPIGFVAPENKGNKKTRATRREG